MMRRHVHDWDGLIAELESSGLSRAEFCRRRKLKYQTMSNWISRRSQSAVTSETVTGDKSRTDRKAGRRRSASASAKGWTSGSASGSTNGSAHGAAKELARVSASGLARFVEVPIHLAPAAHTYEIVLGADWSKTRIRHPGMRTGGA
ncbi:MAG: hypothetical protein ACE5E5_14385 [Phycisphaerae bacterium]